MPNQDLLDSTYMKMAQCWAKLSKAERKQVGCLIVKNGAIISDGYNGTPSGFNNNCELKSENGNLITKPEVLHAESNAISKFIRASCKLVAVALAFVVSSIIDLYVIYPKL